MAAMDAIILFRLTPVTQEGMSLEYLVIYVPWIRLEIKRGHIARRATPAQATASIATKPIKTSSARLMAILLAASPLSSEAIIIACFVSARRPPPSASRCRRRR